MNILPYLIINNVNSQTIQGLIISELAPISKPQQRTRIEEIDGRDGDLVTPLGFAAYDKTVKIGLSYGYDIDEVIEFFNSSGVVTFSNEPDKYYRFAIYQQIDFERLIRFKTAEVVFHCQPFKFSTTEEPLLFDVSSGSPITVTNEGNTQSRPNLTVIGSGEVDLSLNGSQILSLDLEDNQAIIIDTEDMNAYAAQSAISEVVAEINPIQEGSGDPSPSNPRPITGWTEINVTLCGKNLLNDLLRGINGSNIFFGHTGGTQTSYALTLKAGTYTFSVVTSDGTPTNLYIANSDTGIGLSGFPAYNALSKTFTLTEQTNLAIWVYKSGYTSVNDIISAQIERGSEATSYVSYLGDVIYIPFVDVQGEPITVYVGTVNLETGVLTITHKYQDLGDISWTPYNGTFYAQLENAKTPSNIGTVADIICSQYKADTLNHVLGKTTDGIIAINDQQSRVHIYDSAKSSMTGADFKTAMSGVQLVYELATPIEIQLTPTQVNNLLGLNQLYTDTNGDITVTFSSDGVIRTETGDIVSFNCGAEDMQKGILLNRLVTGDYDKIRLRKGVNALTLTGGAQQLVIDKYSRWL